MALYNIVPQPFECEQVDNTDLSNLAAWGLYPRLDGDAVWVLVNGENSQLQHGDWIVKTNDPNARLQYRCYPDADFQLRYTPVEV